MTLLGKGVIIKKKNVIPKERREGEYMSDLRKKELLLSIGKSLSQKQKLNGLNQELNMMYDEFGAVLPGYQGRAQAVREEIERAKKEVEQSKTLLQEAFIVDYEDLAGYLCAERKEEGYVPYRFSLKEGARFLFALVRKGNVLDIDDPTNINLTVSDQKASSYRNSCLCPMVADGDKVYPLAIYDNPLFGLHLLFDGAQKLPEKVRKAFNEYVEKMLLKED